MSLLTKSSDDSPLKTFLEYGIIGLGAYFGIHFLASNIKEKKLKNDAERLIEQTIVSEGKTNIGQYTAGGIAKMLFEALGDFDTNENVIWQVLGSDKKPLGLIQSKEFLSEVKAAYWVWTQRKSTLDTDLKNISLGWFKNFNGSDYQEVLRSLIRINKRTRTKFPKK